jgi:hypothetical protein
VLAADTVVGVGSGVGLGVAACGSGVGAGGGGFSEPPLNNIATTPVTSTSAITTTIRMVFLFWPRSACTSSKPTAEVGTAAFGIANGPLATGAAKGPLATGGL